MKNGKFFQLISIVALFCLLLSFSGNQASAQPQFQDGGEPIDTPEGIPGDQDYPPIDLFDPANDVQDPDSFFDRPAISASPSYTVTLGTWRNLRPTESYLRGISMLPSAYPVNCSDIDQKSKGWIVGNNGVILSYCNGVWEQSIIVESMPTDLYGVQAILPTLSVAVGEQGAILHYSYDQIAKAWVWTKSPIPVGNQILYSVSLVPDGQDGYVGWAVGEKDGTGRGSLIKGYIWPDAIVDGKQTYKYTWDNLTGYFSDLPLVNFYRDVQMISSSEGWAVGGTDGKMGVFLKFDGEKWFKYQEIGKNAIYGVHMISSNNGWAVGKGGSIYHFNGSSWSEVGSPTTGFLLDVKFEENGEGWAVGKLGVLLHYENGSWKQVSKLTTDAFDFQALDFASGHGWMAGFHESMGIGGHILELEEGQWFAVTPPTDNRLNKVEVISDNNAWAVGAADVNGATIIHWDGRHWQRWLQLDLPLPNVDLYALDFVTDDYGWAAGNAPTAGEPAVFLKWDGHRWAPPRYDSPINLRINDIDMLTKDFGWAVANNGNAVAKYDGSVEYWSANHSCYGTYYRLRGVSVIPSVNAFGWDAWAVGTTNPDTRGPERFLRYSEGCSEGYAWDVVDTPIACPNADGKIPTDGASGTYLFGLQMDPNGPWGVAVGAYNNRGSVYYYDATTNDWKTYWCRSQNSTSNPSRLYSVDIVKSTGTVWMGGYYTNPTSKRKVADIRYMSPTGVYPGVGLIFPLNGKNIYHRPIADVGMPSDSMGWAVGDPESTNKISVIYQYPYPNFTLDSIPLYRSVMPGQSTTFNIAINNLDSFDTNVSLEIPAYLLPEGISASISPSSISGNIQATVKVQTNATTMEGEYSIPVWASAMIRSGDNDIPVQRLFNLHLTVTNHPIDDVSPKSGPAGTLVTIKGPNFGPDPGAANRSSDMHNVFLAGKQMPATNVISWTNTEIQVLVPDSVEIFEFGPTEGEVFVTVAGGISNRENAFQVENHIDLVSFVNNGESLEVTITGTSFGQDPGQLFRSTDFEHVLLAGIRIKYESIKQWTNNSITFIIPSTSLGGMLSVTSNGYESNSILFSPQGNSLMLYLPSVRRR